MVLNKNLPSRLGDIPNDWIRVRLSDVMTVRQGLQIAISKRLKTSTGETKEYITIQSINKKDQEREYVVPTSARVICTKEDVLMTRTGNTGIVVTDVEGVFHNNFFLMDFDRSILEKKFLVNYLRSKRVQHLILTKAGASTIPDLNHKDFYSIELPLAPLPEQRKIAKILSTWDKAISTTERLIDNSKQQKKALMQQLLTGKKRLLDDSGRMFEGEWEEVQLGDVCHVNPKKPKKPTDGLVSFVPMDAVSEDTKLMRQESKQYDEVSKGFTSFADNDCLVAKITPCFENGKGAFVNKLINGIGFGSTEFHVLRANKENSSEFIYYITQTREFRVKGEMNMQGSAGQKRVTTDYLKLFKLKVPENIKEQEKISRVLANSDKEIELLEQQLTNLKQEKKALMQQLLTGKRRVKTDDEAVA